jgi:hypothetical protein
MRKFGVVVIAAVVLAIVGFGSTGVASAAGGCMHRFGSHQQLVDGAGVQEWSVTDLRKSLDPAPGYPLAGQLWEATASVTAVSGTETPLIPAFNAPTTDGASYPVLWQLASPQGISGVTVAQGETSTGKLYFDVTGADPVAVTYTAGGIKPLMWCCGAGAMMAMPMANNSCCTHE